jgi:hypothetical protein
MAAFSYRPAIRKTPKIALFIKKEQRHSRKWKAWWIILIVIVVMAMQVILLRSVAIQNQVHSSEIKIVQQTKSNVQQQRQANKETDRINTMGQETQSQRLPGVQNSLSSSSSTPLKLLYEDPPALSEFPSWIRDYVKWHQQVRKDFPGMELLSNPRAPPLLVRTCLGSCGGLHDRIGQLPWDIYLAYKTKRVLLIAWLRPKSLENYLVPSGLLNWTIPEEAHFGFHDMRRARNLTELFQGFPEDHPTEDFFEKDVEVAIQRATVGNFSNIHILRHRLLGHLGQDNLEKRLEAHMDNPQSIHQTPLFGNIFWLFFKPSKPVHEKTKRIMSELQLKPNDYAAVHCRVRHPKSFTYGANIKGKNSPYPADKSGLPWEGETREAALGVAFNALQCASSSIIGTLPSSNQVYFLSDSNDLVRHVTKELPSSNASSFNWTLPQLQQLVTQDTTQNNDKNRINVIGRDTPEQNAHIDRNKGRPAEEYYDTFVDLLIVMHARCVIYGIGYYAAFGAKVSGTSCRYLYQQEAWGATAVKEAEICPEI